MKPSEGLPALARCATSIFCNTPITGTLAREGRDFGLPTKPCYSERVMVKVVLPVQAAQFAVAQSGKSRCGLLRGDRAQAAGG
jgi:hypothetical protein